MSSPSSLAAGYFVLPYTIGDGLADQLGEPAVSADDPVFTDAINAVEDETSKCPMRILFQVHSVQFSTIVCIGIR